MKKFFKSFAAAISICGSIFIAYAEEVSSAQSAQIVKTVPQTVQPVSSDEQNENTEQQSDTVKDLAEEVNSAAQVQEPARKPAKDPSIALINKINAFIEDQNLRSGGRQIFSGVAVVNKPVSHPDYMKYRVFAYEEACLAALTNFFKFVAMEVVTETEQKVFNDQSSNRLEFEDDSEEKQKFLEVLLELFSPVKSKKLKVLTNKVLALTEAQLDIILELFDIDPEQFNIASAEQKKILLSNSLTQKTVQRFSKNLGGVTTLQTFFMSNEDGIGAVGVIIAYSPKIESVADALKTGRKPAIPQKGRPLAEILPLDSPEKLSTVLGTRLLIDENGPVIVSFGQWANSSGSHDPVIRGETRQAAMQQASAMALKELSVFLNQSFSSEIETERSKILNEFATKDSKSGMITEQKQQEIIDKVFRNTQVRSSSYLQGVKTLKEWIYETPEGHEILGVVLVYNFDSVMQAKTIFDKEDSAGDVNSYGNYAPSYEEGAVIMDLDTF